MFILDDIWSDQTEIHHTYHFMIITLNIDLNQVKFFNSMLLQQFHEGDTLDFHRDD